MLSDHLTPCRPLLLLSSVLPSTGKNAFPTSQLFPSVVKALELSFGIISGPLNEATRRSFQKVINSLPCFSNGLLRFFLRRLDTKGR